MTFYREGPGLASPGIVATELHDDHSGAEGAIAASTLEGGLILSLYPRSDLAHDAGVPHAVPRTGEFSLGHIVADRADVDAVLDQAQSAGATVLGKPRDRPWEIFGILRRSRRPLWEVIWNPDLEKQFIMKLSGRA